jgi:hypothetical protein
MDGSLSFYAFSVLQDAGKITTSRFRFSFSCLIPVKPSFLPEQGRSSEAWGLGRSDHHRYKLKDEQFGQLAQMLREKVGLTQPEKATVPGSVSENEST